MLWAARLLGPIGVRPTTSREEKKRAEAKMATLYTRIRAKREICMRYGADEIDRTCTSGEEIQHAVTSVNRFWLDRYFFMLKHQTEKQLAMREKALKSHIP